MTARRASTEVVDEQLAIGTAPRRSMGLLDPEFDDTLVSVQNAKASTVAFEPTESLRSGRELPKLAFTAPSFLRNRAGLQRSVIGVAAFASAGAALIIPQAANAETTDAAIDVARTEVNTIVTRSTERATLNDTALPEATTASSAAANAYLSAAADADATSAEAYAAQLAAAQAAVAAGEQQVADQVEADRLAAEQAAAARAAAAAQATTVTTATTTTTNTTTTTASSTESSAAATAPQVSTGAAASAAGQAAMGVAMAQVGKPYVWGATGPNAFDCSGLMVYSFAQAGVSLPRTSYGMMSVGTAVSQSEMQPGDLIISYGGGHVGMYIGNGMMVHAANESIGVEVTSLAYYSITTVRRVG